MSHSPLAVGIDIGGTHTKIALVTPDGEAIDSTSIRTPAYDGPDAVLAAAAGGARVLIERAPSAPVAVGLGVPGVVNDAGEVAYPPNFPGWTVVKVAERFAPLVGEGLPVAVENDANVAAYAEAKAGVGSSISDFLYVTLGTGVGGCIISGSEIWRGSSGGAGEIGHISIDIDGQLCNCGSRGCIEAYIGQRYMSTLAASRLERDEDSMLHAWIAAGRDVDPKLIDDAAMSGDRFAISFMEEMGTLLGAALASAVNLLDLPVVIVGGGLCRAEKSLLEPARRAMRQRVLRPLADRLELRVARYANDAGVIGAALLAMRQAGARLG